MRTVVTMMLLGVLAGTILAQDDRDKKSADQKSQAQTAWKSLEVGDFSFAETKHLLVLAPKAMDKQLKAKGEVLEKYHDQALKAADLTLKDGYPGKLTVYLFADREQFTSFLLRIAKRRPTKGDLASFKAEDDELHAAACGGGKIPVEHRAGEMIAAALLQRKAGRATVLPDWLPAGFGRATSYQVAAKDKWVQDDRRQIRALAKKKDISAVWESKLEEDELESMQGSLTEFLAYTPSGRKYFAKFVAGYAPGENQPTKTTAQALEAAGLTADRVSKGWKGWVK